MDLLLESERVAVVQTCQRLVPEQLVKGTSGNVSARQGDLVAISPGTMEYDELTPEDVVIVNLDGKIVDGRRMPSSELEMHLTAYRSTSESAVVHTHSPFASVLSTVLDELPAIHYMISTLGGPIRVTDYHIFGSKELAEDVERCLKGRSAVILGSHGGLTVGPSLGMALKRAVTLEWLCAVYYRAVQVGTPRICSADELNAVSEKMKRLSYARQEVGNAGRG